jgi:ferritin-like protein
MKQTIKKIKISDIPEAIERMGIDRETMINLTIETVEDDLLAVFAQIGQTAQQKGLTEEILEELLADES